MKKILPVFTMVITACSGEEARYAWFEDSWASDIESTYLANSAYKDLDDESLNTVMALYGKLHWIVSGTMLRGEYLDESRFDFEIVFEVQPINEESFYLMTDYEKLYIQKSDDGFCLQAQTFGTGNPFECFVPLST